MISSGVFRRVLIFLLLTSVLLVSEGCRTWSGQEERAAEAYNRGNILREAGRGDEAISAYRTALDEAPEFHAAAFNLGLTLIENDSPREALEYLEPLHTLDPGNLTILRAMGWAAWVAGDLELSLGYYDEVVRIFPADIPSRQSKADVLDSFGKYIEAVEVRRQLLTRTQQTRQQKNH